MSHLSSIRTRLTRFTEKRIFPLYFLLTFLFFNKRVAQLHLLSRRTGYQGLDLKRLKRRKSSDTLFILGSGGSINDISEETWKEIKHSDSLGFNFWIMNDHIPDFYMLELPKYPPNREVILEWVNKRKFQLLENNTCVLMKDLEFGLLDFNAYPEELKEASQILYKDSLYGSSMESKRKSLRYVRSLGLDQRNLLYFCRGSLFSAIYFGWKLGYKKIVLGGIDLYNSGYFFDSDEYRDTLRPLNEQRGKVHDTVNKAISNITMDELVMLLDQDLLKPDGCELRVLNASSLLHPRIPLYEPPASREEPATAQRMTPSMSPAER
ncbi:hypothetical protein KG088_10415 [Halomonas sp. TRM85114]|uniref:hypothetical protein n=1 Tax=Halomonas jincaotanensis TaxID=2810616 RepID=UPI001BD25905|nr:hypothetical protein [Halomonas jincaotanensis]MBS9404044.1 hypothetical protein [Halomonas jincaotanensis]